MRQHWVKWGPHLHPLHGTGHYCPVSSLCFNWGEGWVYPSDDNILFRHHDTDIGISNIWWGYWAVPALGSAKPGGREGSAWRNLLIWEMNNNCWDDWSLVMTPTLPHCTWPLPCHHQQSAEIRINKDQVNSISSSYLHTLYTAQYCIVYSDGAHFKIVIKLYM